MECYVGDIIIQKSWKQVRLLEYFHKKVMTNKAWYSTPLMTTKQSGAPFTNVVQL